MKIDLEKFKDELGKEEFDDSIKFKVLCLLLSCEDKRKPTRGTIGATNDRIDLRGQFVPEKHISPSVVHYGGPL